jgi:hypothetical protein
MVDFNWFTISGIVAVRISMVVTAIAAHLQKTHVSNPLTANMMSKTESTREVSMGLTS